MADSDQEALVWTLRRLRPKHPDMMIWWEIIVNELYQSAVGNNTVNEIRLAFDAIKE